MFRPIITTSALTTVILFTSQAKAQLTLVHDYPGATVRYTFDGSNPAVPRISVTRTHGNMKMTTKLGGPTWASEMNIVIRQDHRTRFQPKKLDWLDRPTNSPYVPYVAYRPIVYQNVPFNYNKLPKLEEVRARAITELVAVHYPQPLTGFGTRGLSRR